jgi:hypothetical protein
MKVEIERKDKDIYIVPDGCYRAKDRNKFYKFSGQNCFKIDLGNKSTWVDFSTYYPLAIYEDVEPITEAEWNDAVSNLISTIYLSLPVEATNG